MHSMLHIKDHFLQGEPRFARWDAILKAECAELQGRFSGGPAPMSHLHIMTDNPGLFERFESLGATLRVRHAYSSYQTIMQLSDDNHTSY